MKSEPRGRVTSSAEVTNVSSHGFWLLVDGRELFLPFKEFPWFENATIRQLSHVERHGSDHLYWPALDVDLSIDSIEHPERYPLVSNPTATSVREAGVESRSRKRKSR